MKRVACFILALTIIFLLCACNTSDSNSGEPVATAEPDDNIEDDKDYNPFEGLWMCVNPDELEASIVFFSSDKYIFQIGADFGPCNNIFAFGSLIESMKSTSSEAIKNFYKSVTGESIEVDDNCETYSVSASKNDSDSYYAYISNNEDTPSFEYKLMQLTNEYVLVDNELGIVYEKYDYSMDDSYSYFVGNWTVKEVEFADYSYFDEEPKEYVNNYMISFNDNLIYTSTKTNARQNATWSYFDGQLDLDESFIRNVDVIKLDYNSFIVYRSYTQDVVQYQSVWLFQRA